MQKDREEPLIEATTMAPPMQDVEDSRGSVADGFCSLRKLHTDLWRLRGIDGWIRSDSVDETYAERGEESRHEAGGID